MLLDVVPQLMKSSLKCRVVNDILQVHNEVPDLLMVLQRVLDQLRALCVGQRGHGWVKDGFFQQCVECQRSTDMLGNNLLEVRIRCVLIVLKEDAYLAVIGCEHYYGIGRCGSCLVLGS